MTDTYTLKLGVDAKEGVQQTREFTSSLETAAKAVKTGASASVYFKETLRQMGEEITGTGRRLDALIASEKAHKAEIDRQRQALDSLRQSVGGVRQKFDELNQGAGGLRLALQALGVASITALFKTAVEQAAAFQTQMTKAAVEAGKNAAEIRGLDGAVLDLAKSFGVAPVKQAAALAEVVDAGFNTAAESVKVLTAANKLAKATFTDLGSTTETVLRTMLAFGKSADEAQGVVESLFIAAREGRGSIGEMGALIGRLGTLSNASKISMDDLLAVISAVSTTGQPAQNSMRGLMAVINELSNVTPKMTREWKLAGIEIDKTSLQSRGLSSILQEVITKTGGNAEAVDKLFKSQSAYQTVLTLTNNNGKAYLGVLDAQKEKTTAMSEALDIVGKTYEDQYTSLKEGLNVELIKLGKEIMPNVISALRFVTENMDKLKTAVVSLATFMTTRFIVGALQGSVAALSQLTIATGGTATALGLLRTAFLGLAGATGVGIAVVGAVAAIGYAMRDATAEATNYRSETDNLIASLQTLSTVEVAKKINEASIDYLEAAEKVKKYRDEVEGTLNIQGTEAPISLGALNSKGRDEADANFEARKERLQRLIALQNSMADATAKTAAEEAKAAVVKSVLAGSSETLKASVEKYLLKQQEIYDLETDIEQLRNLNADQLKALNLTEVDRNKLIDDQIKKLRSLTDAKAKEAKAKKELKQEQKDEMEMLKNNIYLHTAYVDAIGDELELMAPYIRLIEKYNPILKETNDYESERAKLIEAVAQGYKGAEEALRKLDQAHALNIIKIQEQEKAGDSWGKTMEHVVERIDSAFADMWKGAFDGFKGFADGLKNAFKQLIAELLHQAITKPIVIRLAMAMGSTGAVQALGGTPEQIIQAAANGQGGGGLLSSLGVGGKILGGLGAFGSSLGAYASSFLTGGTVITPGMLGALSQSSAGLGAIAGQGLAGGGLGVLSGSLANSLLGGRGTNNTALSAVGGVIGSIGGPIGSLIGGAVGSLVSNILGGAKKQIDQGIELGVEEGQLVGNFYRDMKKAKSFFRGWKRYTETDPLDQQLLDTLQQSFDATKDAVRNIATTLGVSTAAIDNFSAANVKFSTAGLSEEEIKAKLEETLKGIATDAIVSFIETTAGLSTQLRQTVLQFRENADELIAAFEFAAKIDITAGIDPILTAQEVMVSNNYRLTTAYRAQKDELTQLIANYDGSLESLAMLSEAFAIQRTGAVELAVALMQTADSIKEMFGGTRESIRESLLSEEELYNYRKSKIDQLVDQLQRTTDPGDLQSLSQQINGLINSTFSSLTDDQKQALGGQFLGFLDEVERIAVGQTQTGLNGISQDSNQINQDIADRMIRVVEQQQAAVQQFDQSVQNFATIIEGLGYVINGQVVSFAELTP